MWVSLKKPYKIISNKEKRYAEHYKIPAASCLIVPHTRREDEMLCDVHWRESDGLHVLSNIMFDSENLELVNQVEHSDLFEMWSSFRPLSEKATETSLPARSILSKRR